MKKLHHQTVVALALIFTVIASVFYSGAFADVGYSWAGKMGGSDNDYGYGVAYDSLGNVYTTGSFIGTADFDPGAGTTNLSSILDSDNNPTNDIFVTKFDSTGAFVWAKQIGNDYGDRGNYITVDSSDNIYVAGYYAGIVDFDPGAGTANITSAGPGSGFILKLDSSGNYVSAVSMGTEITSLAIDGSGNVYAGGYFAGTMDFDPGAGTANFTSNASSYDFFASKLDSSLVYTWAKIIGGNGNDFGYAISVDASGNVFSTGAFQNTVDFDPGAGTANMVATGSYSNDIFISKLDSSGNYAWAKKISSSQPDVGHGIINDSSGNVYITGNFNAVADFDPGAGTVNLTPSSRDTFILKLDSTGAYVWVKQLPSSDGVGYALAIDSSNNVYSTGYFSGTADFDPGAGTTNLTSVSSSQDVFVYSLTSSGVFNWAKSMGGSSSDTGQSIKVDSSGNVYIAGIFSGTGDFDPSAGTSNLVSAGGNDVFVVKLTPLSAPTVTTGSSSSITTTSVILGGNITSTGGSTPTSRGFNYGTTAGYGSVTSESGSYSAGAFTLSVNSLSCGTLYHYQAFATNTNGTGVGDDATFTTSACNTAPTATSVSVTGTLNYNQILTGHYTYNDENGDAEGTSTFRWLRDDVAIDGAISSTYTVSLNDVGHNIAFEVTPKASTGVTDGTPVASSVYAISNLAPVASAVSFSGSQTINQLLTGHYTYTDLEGDEEGVSTFRWLRDDVAIDGAVSTTYTTTIDDVGATLKFEVTPVAVSGTLSGSAVASTGNMINNAAPSASAVSITGVLSIDQELTGQYTYTDDDGDAEGTSTFRWLRDDVAISSATSNVYTTVLADVGHTIKFEVTPKAATGESTGSPAESSGSVILVTLGSVTTADASDVTNTTATLNANTTNIGGGLLTARGFNYGTTVEYGTTTTEEGSFDIGAFIADITDLTCNTAYHYSAYITNAAGTKDGSDVAFTTGPCSSTIVTEPLSSVSKNGALLVGNITNTGGINNTTRGFNYGKTESYGQNILETGSYDIGYFNISVDGLECNTLYHYRAFSENTSGTSFGSDQTFQTSSCVSTHEVREVEPPVLAVEDEIEDEVIPPTEDPKIPEVKPEEKKEEVKKEEIKKEEVKKEEEKVKVPEENPILAENTKEENNSKSQDNNTSSSNDDNRGGGRTERFFENIVSSKFVTNINNALEKNPVTKDMVLGYKETRAAAKKIIETPVGEKVAEIAPAVGVVSGVTASVATGIFINPFGASELFLIPFRLWALLLTALGLKKKNRPWGTVYDSVTKQPLDPAYVILKDMNGNEVATSITDLDGRYGFLVEPGTYTLEAKKTNYVYPSEKMKGKLEDELYNDLYFSAPIIITKIGEVIAKNIPMDPIKFDWNEFTKNKQHLMKFYSERQKIFARISNILFIFGFGITFAAVLTTSTTYNVITLVLYGILFILKSTVLRPKLQGSVKEKSAMNPLSYAIIRVFSSNTKREVIHKITDKLGHYYCLIPNGEYYVSIEKKKQDGTYELIHTSNTIKVDKGYLYADFLV